MFLAVLPEVFSHGPQDLRKLSGAGFSGDSIKAGPIHGVLLVVALGTGQHHVLQNITPTHRNRQEVISMERFATKFDRRSAVVTAPTLSSVHPTNVLSVKGATVLFDHRLTLCRSDPLMLPVKDFLVVLVMLSGELDNQMCAFGPRFAA